VGEWPIGPIEYRRYGSDFGHFWLDFFTAPTQNLAGLGGGMRATDDDSHRVLLKALREPQDNYRRWMRPADIIEQSMMEQRHKKPIEFADLLQKLGRYFSKV